MSTQTLLDKIKASSADTITQIEADTQAAIAAIERSAADSVATIESDAATAADKAAAAVERATLAKARQAGRLAVQTARREAFDAIMAAAQSQVGDDKAQAWSDARADLEMHLSKHIQTS